MGVKVRGQLEKALFKWYGILSFSLIIYIFKPSFILNPSLNNEYSSNLFLVLHVTPIAEEHLSTAPESDSGFHFSLL